jgi:hypothetical protein
LWKVVCAGLVAGGAKIGPFAEELLTHGLQLGPDGINTLLAHRYLIGACVDSSALRLQGSRKLVQALRFVARVAGLRIDRCQYQERDGKGKNFHDSSIAPSDRYARHRCIPWKRARCTQHDKNRNEHDSHRVDVIHEPAYRQLKRNRADGEDADESDGHRFRRCEISPDSGAQFRPTPRPSAD